MTSLSDLTTLRVGGPAARLVEVDDVTGLVEAVRTADAAHEPLLVLGGGSNLLPSDDTFEGTVVRLLPPGTLAARAGAPSADGGISVDLRGDCAAPIDRPAVRIPVAPGLELADAPLDAVCGGALVEVFAGTVWDDFVAAAVRNELRGVEALSGIPGTVGAVPVQNVGAYGQEVAATISRVVTWDRELDRQRTFTAGECGFGYRTSIFKRTPFTGTPGGTGRYVVLTVQFQFLQGDASMPIAYAELARRLGTEPGGTVPMTQVRETVLRIRASKGMVLDAADHDTWSAGSFFTNPLLDPAAAADLPADAPRFPTADGQVKTSAAWLIDHAGFTRGFGLGTPPRATLSTKHVLALTNRGSARAEDIVELARTVRARVQDTFGVHLEIEPVRLGLEL